PDSQRQPAVKQGDERDAGHAGRELPDREVEARDRAEDEEGEEDGGGDDRDLNADDGTLAEDGVAPAQGAGEQQLEPPRVLISGDLAGPGADRHHQQEQRQDQVEELDIEVPRTGGDAGRNAEQLFQRLRVVLDQLVEVRGAVYRREDRREHRRVGGRSD